MSFLKKLFGKNTDTSTNTAKMNQAEFGKTMMQAIQRQISGLQVKPTNDNLAFICSVNGQEFQIDLQSAFAEYHRGIRFEDVLDSRLKSLVAITQPKTTAVASQFFPILRASQYIDNILDQIKANNLEQKVYHADFVGSGVQILYMRDNPDSFSMLSEDDLAQAQVNEADLPKIALQNFHDYWQGKISITKMDDFDIYSIKLDDNYESSLMLDEAFWESDLIPLKGQYLAFIPARSELILSAVDARTASVAKQVAINVFNQHGYRLSPEAFMRVQGMWVGVEMELAQR